MSKLSTDQLDGAIQAILSHATLKQRNFLETIELQATLKHYDPMKQKRFTGMIHLPVAPKPRFTVCVIGDAKDCEKAKAAGIPSMSQDYLKSLKKDKKLVKKMWKTYDTFFASASLIRMIPRILGPGFGKAGKFPAVLGPNEDLVKKVAFFKQSIKFQLKSKTNLSVGVPVANVGMSHTEVQTNITLAVNFIVSLLSQNWNQVDKIYIKSTMGPSYCILN